MKLTLQHGMKRSGNHAITTWLEPQMDFELVNNFIPIGPLLQGVSEFPAPVPFRPWLDSLTAQERGHRKSSVLVTLEDHAPGLVPFCQVDVPIQHLLVLRHADDLFSSRIRKAFRVDMAAYPRQVGPVMNRAVRLWKQHARWYLGLAQDLPPRVAISFDTWVIDPGYRQSISHALRLTFTDDTFRRVSMEGGGSSFDGTSYDGLADEMNVSNRVSLLEPHEKALLDEVFGDAELRELNLAVTRASAHDHLIMN